MPIAVDQLFGSALQAQNYRPRGESPLNLTLMRLIDEQFLRAPFYGSFNTDQGHFSGVWSILTLASEQFRLRGPLGPQTQAIYK